MSSSGIDYIINYVIFNSIKLNELDTLLFKRGHLNLYLSYNPFNSRD